MGSMTVDFSDGTLDRLEILAKRTGKPMSSLINEAVLTKLADYEDYEEARVTSTHFRQSKESALDLSEVKWPSGDTPSVS